MTRQPLALGLNSSGKLASMLLSRDGGITWRSDKSFTYPTGVQAANSFTLQQLIVTNNLWVISGTKVWRG